MKKSAKRFSASMEFSRIRQANPRRVHRSAKRFSASMEFSPFSNRFQVRRFRVLNAFQHQWNFHGDAGNSFERKRQSAKRFSASMEFSLNYTFEARQ